MLIETYILAHNEERRMAYCMRHYSQFSQVIILENNSTDRQCEIAESMGARIWSFDVPDVIDNQWYMNIKGSCWKGSKADWVIIADADEFVYHPDLISILEKTKATIFQPQLFNMFCEKFPTTTGQIYEEVTLGVEGGGKRNIFRPDQIEEINYEPGCHMAHPTGNVIFGTEDIKTLHFRGLGKEFMIERNRYASARRSENDKKNGWAIHYTAPEELVCSEFDKYFAMSEKVI